MKINAAVFIAGCDFPTFREIDDDLSSLQALVGGYIEAVPLDGYLKAVQTGLTLICNEDGKQMNLPANRQVPGDVIAGTFFIIRTAGEDFASITLADEIFLTGWTSDLKWGAFSLCDHCGEPITPEEMFWLSREELRTAKMLGRGVSMHQECSFRAVCGSAAHLLKECSCYGGDQHDPPGLSRRDAARLALETYRTLHSWRP
jgi:hypothetical protein